MPHLVLTCYLSITTAYLTLTDQLDALAEQRRSRCRGDRGQATTEYALVLLAAALVLSWSSPGPPPAAGRLA